MYDEAGTYNVVVTVADDENSDAAATMATIFAAELLDLDIDMLRVSETGYVGKSIGEIRLVLESNGTMLGQAIAMVVGVQNGIEVFRLRLNLLARARILLAILRSMRMILFGRSLL